MRKDAILRIIFQAVDQVSGEMGKIGQSVSGLGGSFGPLGAIAGAALGVIASGVGILGGALVTAIGDAADFQQIMANINAVLRPTAAEYAAISDEVQRLGRETRFTVGEAGLAVEALARGGGTTKDILTGMGQAALELAAATKAGMSESAQVILAVMHEFKLGGDDLAGAVDAISGAVNNANMDIGGFRNAMMQVGSIANSLGVPLKEVTAALTQFGQEGIVGERAGTGLKTMLLYLVPKTKDAADAFKQYGLMTQQSTSSVVAATKSVSAISGELQMATAGMTKAQKESYLSAQFGASAWNENGKSLRSYGELARMAVKDHLGLAQGTKTVVTEGKAMNAFFDSTTGKLKPLGEVFQLLQDKFANMDTAERVEAFKKMFGIRAQTMAMVLEASNSGAAGFQKFMDIMDKSDAATTAQERMKSLLGVIEILKGHVETAAIQIGMPFVEALEKAGRAIFPMAEAIQPAIKAFADWERGAINQLPGKLKELTGIDFSKITGALKDFEGKDFGTGLRDFLTDVLGPTNMKHIDDIATSVQNFGKWISDPATLKGAQEIGGSLKEFAGHVLGIVGGINDLIKKWGEWTGGSKKEPDTGGSKKGPDTGGLTQGGGVGQMIAAWNELKGVFADIPKATEGFQRFLAVISTPFDMTFWSGLADTYIRPALADVDKAIATWVQGAAQKGSDFVAGLVGGMGDVGSKIAGAISGAGAGIGEVAGVLATQGQTWQTNVSTATQGIVTDIQTKWATAVADTSAKYTEISTNISTKWAEIKATISTALSDIYNDLRLKWDSFLREISDKMEKILGTISTKWGEISSTVTTKLGEISTALSTKWGEMVTATQTKWEEVKQAVSTKIGEAKAAALRIAGEIKSEIDTKWGEIVTATQTKWEEAKQAVSTKIGEAKAAALRIAGEIKSEIGTKWGEIVTSAGAEWDKLKGVVDSAVRKIFELFNSGSQLIHDAIAAIGGLASSMAQGLLDAWNTEITKLQDNFWTAISSLLDWILSKIKGGSPARHPKVLRIGTSLAMGLGLGFATEMGNQAGVMANSVVSALDVVRQVTADQMKMLQSPWAEFDLDRSRALRKLGMDMNRTGRGGFVAASAQNYYDAWSRKWGKRYGVAGPPGEGVGTTGGGPSGNSAGGTGFGPMPAPPGPPPRNPADPWTGGAPVHFTINLDVNGIQVGRWNKAITPDLGRQTDRNNRI